MSYRTVLGQVRSLTHSPTPPLNDQLQNVVAIVTGCNQALVSMGTEEEYLALHSQVGLLQIILVLTHTHTQTQALQVHQPM